MLTAVSPGNFGLPILITIYAIVILGGIGSLTGVVLGASNAAAVRIAAAIARRQAMRTKRVGRAADAGVRPRTPAARIRSRPPVIGGHK